MAMQEQAPCGYCKASTPIRYKLIPVCERHLPDAKRDDPAAIPKSWERKPPPRIEPEAPARESASGFGRQVSIPGLRQSPAAPPGSPQERPAAGTAPEPRSPANASGRPAGAGFGRFSPAALPAALRDRLPQPAPEPRILVDGEEMSLAEAARRRAGRSEPAEASSAAEPLDRPVAASEAPEAPDLAEAAPEPVVSIEARAAQPGAAPEPSIAEQLAELAPAAEPSDDGPSMLEDDPDPLRLEGFDPKTQRYETASGQYEGLKPAAPELPQDFDPAAWED